MLNKVRASAHGIFGRVLLAVLVLSFGIWGIGDIFRVSGSSSAVATVGKSAISVQEFSHALRQRQDELQRRLGSAYNPDMLKKFHIDLIVRDELINNHLIENEAQTLGIVPSDEDVAKVIGQVPEYQDKNGKFDRNAFTATLKNRGISEDRYVADVRKTLASQLLIDGVLLSVIVPHEMVDAIYKARQEQRTATLLTLIPAAVTQPPAISDQDIKSYYDANSKLFQTPEYRDVSYIDLKMADIQSKVEVSDEDIKQAYNDKQQDYQQPERRELQQMIFEKKDDAFAAYDKLQRGSRFDDVLKNSPATNKATADGGLVSKQGLPAEEAAVVFDLKEGGVSNPFQSEFGWHIFHVSKIVPPSVTPLANVRADIAKELSSGKAMDTLTRLTNQIEDDVAGGMSLEDAAKKSGFKVQTLKQVSREGLLPDGKKAALPPYVNFAETVFSYGEKEHSQAVQTPDGSYFILRVDGITPESTRPLAEVKDKIISVLKSQKTAEALQKIAMETAEKLRAGKKVDVATASSSSGAIKRDSTTTEDKQHSLPNALVAELFGLQLHQYTHAYRTDNGDYVIASLDKVTPAPSNPSAKDLEEISGEIKETLQHQVMNDYLKYLRSKYTVSINQAAFAVKDENGQD